jgi:hypothetical protein
MNIEEVQLGDPIKLDSQAQFDKGPEIIHQSPRDLMEDELNLPNL